MHFQELKIDPNNLKKGDRLINKNGFICHVDKVTDDYFFVVYLDQYRLPNRSKFKYYKTIDFYKEFEDLDI